MIRALISGFLRPPAIQPIPKGMQGVDPVGLFGILGFWQNANSYAAALGSIATGASNVNITAAQVASGIVQLNAGATGNFTATLPTTSAIFAALGNTIPFDGSYSKPLLIINNLTGQSGVLTAGDTATTIVGTAIIGSNVARSFIMQVLNSSTLSITNTGALLV